MKDKTLNSSLHTLLVGLSNSAAGFSASDVTGYSPETVRCAAEALVRAGTIVRHKVGPRRVRYFANDTLARAHGSGQAPKLPSPLAVGARSKARWSADEPGIITERTRITVAPPLPDGIFRTNTYPQF
jgi:hypothetical protein